MRPWRAVALEPEFGSRAGAGRIIRGDAAIHHPGTHIRWSSRGLLPLLGAACVEAAIIAGLVLAVPTPPPSPEPELLRVTLVAAPADETSPDPPPLPALGNDETPPQLPEGHAFAVAPEAPSAPALSEEPDLSLPAPAATPAPKAPPRPVVLRHRPKPHAQPPQPAKEVARSYDAAPSAEPGAPSVDVQWTKKDETTLALGGTVPPTASPGQSTAIYSVRVGGAGDVRGIEVLRSSGTSALDAAGVTMIRTSMPFDPPRDARDGATAIVTIRFVWDPS